DDERGLRRVATGHAGDDARAPRGRVEVLRSQSERLEPRTEILSGLRLAVRVPTAPVRGVEADEVARDRRGRAQRRPVLRSLPRHDTTLEAPMPIREDQRVSVA